MSKQSNIIALVGTVAISAGIYLLLRNTKVTTMTSYLGRKDLPRGYRNNNPLNIRINSGNNWQGKLWRNTDGAFEQFQYVEYGYRAALVLLRNYIRSGNNTIQKIITRWAPNNENNTDGYIKRVCTTLDAIPSDTINATDREQMAHLVYAMAIVENGNTPAPSLQQIYAGWNLI